MNLVCVFSSRTVSRCMNAADILIESEIDFSYRSPSVLMLLGSR